MFFKGVHGLLEIAIEKDDAIAIREAIGKGATPDFHGENGVTPLILAVGKSKKNAVIELLKHNVSISTRDQDGDNAVTLAVSNYKGSPEILEIILAAGGDPNTRGADDNPVIVDFMIDINIDAIKYLKSKGANIDIRNRSERPLVVASALSGNWDVVWTLLELGSKYDFTGENWTLERLFINHKRPPLDSPLWPYKEKSWKYLCEKGLEMPPLRPEVNCEPGEVESSQPNK